ncbi:hypothetical protein [Vibrio splendidus]|uniref:hypothetical protein n=1 Tax=Vibrio splendidus TaxID=29497 RepID=UPI003D0C9F3C
MSLLKKLKSIIIVSAVIYSFAYVFILLVSVTNQIKTTELLPKNGTSSTEVNAILTQLKLKRDENFEGNFADDGTLEVVKLDSKQQSRTVDRDNFERNETNSIQVLNWLFTPTNIQHHIAIILIYSILVYLIASLIRFLLQTMGIHGKALVVTKAISSKPIILFIAVGTIQVSINWLFLAQ